MNKEHGNAVAPLQISSSKIQENKKKNSKGINTQTRPMLLQKYTNLQNVKSVADLETKILKQLKSKYKLKVKKISVSSFFKPF